jgi:HlyD family secretion protein
VTTHIEVGAIPAARPEGSVRPASKPAAKGTHRRWIPILAAALAVSAAGAGFAGYKWTRPPVSPFRTAQVVRTDITERVSATGTLQPVVTSPVGAQVSGIVWKLHADFNSPVKAGQILVELDPALFQNAIAQAEAQLLQAQATVVSTRATANGARIAWERMESLQLEGVGSMIDLDAARATAAQTAALARSSVAQVAQARATLDRAKLDFQHSIIRSPVDGKVISRNIDVGQAVAATLTAPTLFTIAQDLRHMQVHSAVDEADIGEVVPGQTATFTVDAFRDETFAAVVREVRNAPQTAQNVVTYDVVLDVDNPDEKLRPGMTANVLILIVQKSQVVAVPNEALRFRPSSGPSASAAAKPPPKDARAGPAVYVPEGTIATRTPITLGVTDGTMTEVEGIEPGRKVIVDAIRDKPTKLASGGP